MKDLNLQANQSFKAGEMKAAIRLYNSALKVCEVHSLLDEASTIHNNLARVWLEVEQYETAYKHCDISIRLSQNNPKVSA